jgi:hypothetical protein
MVFLIGKEGNRLIPRNRALLLIFVVITLLDLGNAFGVRSSRCCGLIAKNWNHHPAWTPSLNTNSRSLWFLHRQSLSSPKRTVVYDIETDAASVDIDLSSSTVIVHPQLNHTAMNGGVSIWSAPRDHPESDHHRGETREDNTAESAFEENVENQSPNAEENPSVKDDDEDALTLPPFLEMEESGDDVPRPTENGGYSHTKASRAKISAANRGKVPWNKGITRSEEVKAKIAAGVRKKNRERFLQKLKSLGLTEEQYEQQKKEGRRRKEAERRARMTEKGGYRATEETKQKISRILKEKYASGEIQPRKLDPNKVRRGFSHSEETRRKISESLRKRWADDEQYRSKMQSSTRIINSDMSVRQKISESLKMKWQDPEFRQEMLTKIANRTYPRNVQYDEEHRAKISAAMKAKWQDEEYRRKTQESIAKRRQTMPARPKKPKKRVTRAPSVRQTKQQLTNIGPGNTEWDHENLHHDDDGDDDPILAVKPLQPLVTPRKKVLPQQKVEGVPAAKTVPGTGSTRSRPTPSSSLGIEPVTPRPAPVRRSAKPVPPPQRPTRPPAGDMLLHDEDGDEEGLFLKNDEYDDLMASDSRFLMKDLGHDVDHDDFPSLPKSVSKGSSSAVSRSGVNGNVDLLKEERRDLYDLLYGEEDEDIHHHLSAKQHFKQNGRHQKDSEDGSGLLNRNRRPSQFASLFDLEDEDLDTFDPYGLQDF